jgi:endonuclease/exonuclease/phosphatase family metal-dependent hydrolase
VPTIQLLTWNLAKRDAALDLLAPHVASLADAFIIAVQECADDHAAIAAKVQGHGGRVVHSMGNGTMSILCSEPVTPMAPPRDAVGQRLVLTHAAFAGRRLAIVNYHGTARGIAGALDEVERGGSASEARWRIDEHAAGGSVVVLGDFNADPTSAEIQSMFCFSFATEPSPASGRSHDRDRSILRVFPPPAVTPAAGTYAWKTSHTQGPGFRLYDYFAAGPNLTVRQPRVLRKLGRTPLTDGTWPIASDHLPVAGILDLP